MNVEFVNEIPDRNDFYKLFITTGWNNKYKLSIQELYDALKSSWYLVSAYKSSRLVGFGRVIADGIVHALILDLIVLPEFQNQGIGDKILILLVEKCKENNIRDIQLFCAKGYTGFYEKRGFRKRPDNAPGMEHIHSTF